MFMASANAGRVYPDHPVRNYCVERSHLMVVSGLLRGWLLVGLRSLQGCQRCSYFVTTTKPSKKIISFLAG